MSSKHFSSKDANVKLVQNRNPFGAGVNTTAPDSQVVDKKQGLSFKPTKLTACILATLSMADLLPSTVVAEVKPMIAAGGEISVGLRNDGVLFQFGGESFTPVTLGSNVVTPSHPEAAILTNVKALPQYTSSGIGQALLSSVEGTALFTWQPQTNWGNPKPQPMQAVSDVKTIIETTGNYSSSRFVTTNAGSLYRLDYNNTTTQIATGISDVKTIVEGGSINGNDGSWYSSYMVLTNAGTVLQGGWTWDNKFLPATQVPGLTNVKMVVSGNNNDFYALTQLGEVYAWQWDIPNNKPMTATKFSGLPSNVIQIKNGAALTANGEVYRWYPKWDDITQTNVLNPPTKVTDVLGVTQLANLNQWDYQNQFALTSTGEVYLLGWNYGNNSPTATQKISGISGVSRVYSYNGGYLAMTTDGKVYRWSMNWDNNAYVPTPATLVLSNVKGFFPKEFEQGNYYYGPVVAMTQAGELFLLGDDPNNFTATKISGVPQVSEVKVSQGWPKTTFVALTTGKEVYTWEWDRGTKALTTATKVSGLSNNTTTIQIGDNWGNNLHVLALKEDGMLCGWGDNSVGQLGAQNPNPVPITAPVCFEDLIVSSSTKLVIDAPVSMCAGSTFNVTIRAEKEDTQVIDGIQLALKFDKSKLKVNSVTNSGVLDYEMANTFDNATGDIGFMAGIWENAAPTSSFDVFTINFTALSSTAGTTLLDFLDDNIMLTSGEEALNIMATDNTLTFNQCLDYQVNLQRAKPKPDASWKTDLKVSVGSITNAQEYPTTSDTSGKGTLTLANPIVAGDYMCVKNSHTLANQVVQAFGNPVDFGTLLEGDATNDNKINLLDLSPVTLSNGKCVGTAGYNAQADFNGDGCVNINDRNYLQTPPKGNLNKASACPNKLGTMYRRGTRDGNRNTVTLGATTIPTGLKVGTSFDYTVQVNANEAQAADGAAVYLNFDPAKLSVNRLTAGQSFDFEMENSFDNTKGEINFTAGTWDNPAPTQTVDLVTINFTLLSEGGEQTLAFSTEEERQTMIAGGGKEVTALSEDGTVVVEPVTITPPPVTNYSASGKLFAEPNMPLAGATIHIGDKTTVTDKLGNWQIDGLTNGNYTATATKNGYTIPTQKVVINGEDLTFDLGVVYSAYGIIKDEQKQPVAGVTITIGDQHTQTDAVGYWKLDGLPAGESTLIASKDGYKFAPAKFVLGDQEPNIEVVVTPASTLVMTAKPSPWQAIRQGANVTYTYTLFNGGVSTATGVTFTETVPKGAKLVTLTAKDGGDCDAQTLTCTLPDLTAGATAQVELVLQATDGNSLKNTATASANEYPADVQTSYKTVKPHLSVTVTDNHDPVVMLTDLHYTATVELSPLAPQDTAKDINLVMQLPKGLALKTITTAAGTCDSSQFPLVTCQLPNLSIATPDSVSQTQVEMDVTLKDAGLLVLTNESKVTASNYPAHTVREKTNIFIPDNIKVDMALVIDTTNSMQTEINGVKNAIDQLIAAVPAGQRPMMALIEFKDDVRVKAFTQDTDVMLGAVAKLVAEGGGTCPEASAEALEVALKHVKDGGTILLATDASPYPEANLEKLAALIKSQNMKFNALITGDCSSEGDWNEMTK